MGITDVFITVRAFSPLARVINIRARRINAKSVNASNFLSFANIVCARDGTEGSNSHIRDTMITRGKMSGYPPTVFSKTCI